MDPCIRVYDALDGSHLERLPELPLQRLQHRWVERSAARLNQQHRAPGLQSALKCAQGCCAGIEERRKDPELVHGLTGHLIGELLAEAVVEVVAELRAVLVLKEPRGPCEQLIDVPCGSAR